MSHDMNHTLSQSQNQGQSQSQCAHCVSRAHLAQIQLLAVAIAVSRMVFLLALRQKTKYVQCFGGAIARSALDDAERARINSVLKQTFQQVALLIALECSQEYD